MHVPTLLINAERFDIAASDIYLLASEINKYVTKHILVIKLGKIC